MLTIGAVRVLRSHDGRLHIPYLTGTLSADAYAALAVQGWAPTSLAVAPGITLNGLVRRPSAPDAPWVLFYSGNDQTPLATARTFLERLREGHDWGLATYAYRGYDSSGGSPSRDPMTEDAKRILGSLLEQEHLSPSRLHLVAFSFGGYFAVRVAGAAALAHESVASVSLLAGALDVELVPRSREWAASVIPGDVYQTLPWLDAVPAPVLVLQGDADTTTLPEHGRAIAARLGSRAQYVELPGVGHPELLRSEAAVAAVRRQIESTSLSSPEGIAR